MSHRMRSLPLIALFAGVTFANACLIHRAADGDVPNLAVINADELESIHVSNALEAISTLRPMYLMSRGKLSFDNSQPTLPNIYVDNQFYGDATVLRTISIATIDSIQFFSGSEAQYRFGRGNAAGVIGIFTKH